MKGISAAVRCALAALTAAAAFATSTLAARADAAAPSFVDPVAHAGYGHTSGAATLTMKIEGLTPQQMQKPTVLGSLTDNKSPATTTITGIDAKEVDPKGATTRLYLVTVNYENLPLNDTQTRYLRFQVDGVDRMLQYTLANTAAANFSWTVTGMPIIAIHPGAPIPVTVRVGPVSATGVKVVQAALADTVTKAPMSGGNLVVCPTRSACRPDERSIELRPNSAQDLWLFGTSGPGQFTGSVTLVANEKPSGDAVPMTVYSSSGWYKIGGIAAIALGVGLSWVLTVWVRNRLNRDQMLLPVRPLQAALADLEQRLAHTEKHGLTTGSTDRKIAQLTKDLSDDALVAAGLPRTVPIPSASPLGATPATFQTYVQTIGTWIADLAIIIDGLQKVLVLWVTQNAANNAAVTTAVTTIDGFSAATAPQPTDQLTTQVNAARTVLHTALTTAGARFAASADVQAPSAQSLRVEIDRLSYAAWGIVGLLTVAVGAYILVFSAGGAGFGTVQDYLACFFWGLGLPSGATLMQSTTTSVATTFNIPR